MYIPAIQRLNRYKHLQRAASTYLTVLEETVSDSTYWSHRQAVKSFTDWTNSERPHAELEVLTARFIGDLTGDSDYTDETVSVDHIERPSTLSNSR